MTVAVLALLGLSLSSCPSYRDGMAGQLASAKKQTQSASRSGALALDLWSRGRGPRNLTIVQLSDARDQVADSLQTIGELRADNRVDLEHQSALVRSMATTIRLLNGAAAAVAALPGSPDPQALRKQLMATASALDRDYP